MRAAPTPTAVTPLPADRPGDLAAVPSGPDRRSPAPVDPDGATRPHGRWTFGDRADARFGGALALGVAALGDLLLRGRPLGINLVLWTAAVAAALFTLARRRGRPVTVAAALLAALAVAFAACTAWRDATALTGLALLGLVTSAAALARALRDGAGWAFENAEVAVYAAGGWAVAREMVAGPRAMGLDGAALREWTPGEAPVHAAATSIRGALLAAPVLGLFALLLSAADGAFASLVGRVFDIDLVALGGHALWTLGGGWVLAGYAAGAVFAAPAARADCAAITVTGGVRRLRIGAAEVVVAVGLVDALLAAFFALQGVRLFGAPRLGTAPGDGYAELARRGFFELSAVAALALPLLVAAASVVRRAAPGDFTRRAFRTAAGLLLALLGALLLSAADRMRLYEAAYGLTELRLYVLGFLAWLAAVFAWAAATLLRERPGAFALGGTVLAWAAVFVMHAADPAALVVRVNASRAAGAPALDVPYLASLGPDAVPELAARVLPRLSALATSCDAVAAVNAAFMRVPVEDGGWRSWNLARSRAASAARAARASGRMQAALADCERRPVVRPAR